MKARRLAIAVVAVVLLGGGLAFAWTRLAPAKARHIPERFLLKVLKPLVSARVLMSVKGPNGGYRIAKSPSQIQASQCPSG